ncbi:MAG: hypothetical protein HYT07_02450 [Candidatus Levybacteria bacterium]|nr:hypothetical protein [Candidatus Levybacteria bacterium]
MKKTETNKQREYLPTLADLIDSLTINQIKEIKFHDKKISYAKELKKICHDIDLIIDEKKVKINSKLIRIIIIIAQLNIYIWENKDRMQKEDGENYLKLLKHAHQLNGIRNSMKNKILEEIGDKDPSKKRTNVETDGLEGWDISVE